MNLTVSPQIKILALVGLLAAVGLGASMFVLGGSSKKTATSTTRGAHAGADAHDARTAADEATQDAHTPCTHADEARDEDARGDAREGAPQGEATPTLPRQPGVRAAAEASAVAARASQGGRRQLLQPELRRRRDLGRRGACRRHRRGRRLPARQRARQQGRRAS